MTENRAVADRYADLMTAATGCIIERTAPLTHRRGFHPFRRRTRATGNGFLPSSAIGRGSSTCASTAPIWKTSAASPPSCGALSSPAAVTDPSRDYHLEWAVPFRKLAGDLMALVAEAPELDLRPKLATRKGGFVVYLKGSEAITDLLAYIGRAERRHGADAGQDGQGSQELCQPDDQL